MKAPNIEAMRSKTRMISYARNFLSLFSHVFLHGVHNGDLFLAAGIFFRDLRVAALFAATPEKVKWETNQLRILEECHLLFT